jgi:hypothetical protein
MVLKAGLKIGKIEEMVFIMAEIADPVSPLYWEAKRQL